MGKYMLIACGGAFGAVARALLGDWVLGKWGPYPYGTMVVNLIGCLLIGLILGAYMNHPEWPQWARYLLAVGGLGAFTTFSTFAFELLQLMMKANATDILLYGGVQLVGGLILCALGIGMARLI